MRVALAQLAPASGDLDRNLRTIADVVAANAEADLAVFPELFLSGYLPHRALELAVGRDDEPFERLAEVATAHSVAVVFGFVERLAGGACANSAAAIDGGGGLVAVHRKALLFGPAEERTFERGDVLDIGRIAGRDAGMMVCYEVEFPEPARLLACAGAELLVTVAANMEPYGPDHDLAARARALDNRRPHVYVNRVGSESGCDFVGGSMLIGQDGRPLLRAGTGEGVFVGDLRWEPVDAAVDYGRRLRGDLRVSGSG